jgi:hypothetical protein
MRVELRQRRTPPLSHLPATLLTILLPLLLTLLVPESAAAAASKPNASANKHALGDWDEGAKAAQWFHKKHRDVPFDPTDWRIHLGVSAGTMIFSGELDLGGGNYDLKLTPHGGLSYAGRLGIDFGRFVSVIFLGSYTSTTYFDGGERADIWTALGGLVARYGGFYHPQWEVFGQVAGGVMILSNEPDYMLTDTDGVMQITAGTRFVGGWLIPRIDVSALLADGLERGSSSVSWQLMLGVGLPLVSW